MTLFYAIHIHMFFFSLTSASCVVGCVASSTCVTLRGRCWNAGRASGYRVLPSTRTARRYLPLTHTAGYEDTTSRKSTTIACTTNICMLHAVAKLTVHIFKRSFIAHACIFISFYSCRSEEFCVDLYYSVMRANSFLCA